MTTKRLGRNDKCPCGSGKKYKNCHLNTSGNGAVDSVEQELDAALAAVLSQDPETLAKGVAALEALRRRDDLSLSQSDTVSVNLARGFQWQGRHRDALELLAAFLKTVQDPTTLRAWILHLIAISLGETGRYDEALGYVEEALSQPPADDPQLRAGLALEAGNLFNATRQFDRAKEMWQRALQDYERVQDAEAIARTKSNLATLALKDASHEVQDQAASVLEAISAEKLSHGDLIGLTNNWFHISGHYRRRRHFQAALAYARKDLSLSRTLGNHREVVKSLDNLAMIYLECRQPTAARSAIREARQIGERLGNEAVIANADRALEVIDDVMRKAHVAGEAVGPNAPCACGRPLSYGECCGRADFDPFDSVPSQSFGVVGNLRPVTQEPGASASRLDYFLRDGTEVQDRRAWHRIDAHDGWRDPRTPDAANIHLAAARALAAESQLDPDGMTKPAGALILSACAVEAFVNQTAFFFVEAKRSDDSMLPPLPPELIGDVLDFQRKTSVSEKWRILGTTMCMGLWPPNVSLWEEFLRLVELRNELVHFKSAEYEQIVPPPRKPHRMIERLASSVSVRPITASWPERLLTPALAEWAVSTADQMMKSFRAAYALARRQSDAE